jgi:hypothetical protein
MSHTFAVWWKSEPTASPFTAPDAFGGGLSSDDARARAEHCARAFGATGDVIELPTKWARAARLVRQGEHPWPEEVRSSEDAVLRSFADARVEKDLAAVRRYVRRTPGVNDTAVFTVAGSIVTEFDRSWTIGGRVQVERFSSSPLETLDIDPHELATDGRAWSRKARCYYFARPKGVTYRAPKESARRAPEPPPRPVTSVDAFAALGLAAGATESDIRRAYRKLAFRAHPDRGGDAARFIEITRARDRALAAVTAH